MKIAVSQINPIVGDIEHNYKLIINNIDYAISEGANLLVLPELALIGYPPKDLILKHGLYEMQKYYIDKIRNYTKDLDFAPFAVIFGAITKNRGFGKKFYNSLVCFSDGETLAKTYKTLLPNYDVFDETRYFEPAPGHTDRVVEFNGLKFGLSICEDVWIEAYPLSL